MKTFYDRSTPERTLVPCPTCGEPCDPWVAEQGGHSTVQLKTCRPPRRRTVEVPKGRLVKSPAALIHEWALTHRELSANSMRVFFDGHGVKESQRDSAFGTAVRNGWVELVRFEQSTDAATKGHRIAVYRSLVVKEKAA